MSILETINGPENVQKIPRDKLPQLAQEVRERILNVVCRQGGHLSTNLGSVELTIALHRSLDLPEDAIIWDVGHQAYTHKLFTGRNDRFDTLRQLGGLSGFPCREESKYDIFTAGHSSTSISQALGLKVARELQEKKGKVVAVIGDASLAGGMAFEALNNAGHLKRDLLIVLNDNEHSISPTVGALSNYLNKIITAPIYNRLREDIQRLVQRLPFFGFRAARSARRLEESLKSLLVPGMFFEELGFRYFGPIDGHNIDLLIDTFRNILSIKGPCLIHLLTKKGKGYKPAEVAPSKFHSAPPFDIETGQMEKKEGTTFTQVFGKAIVKLAEQDKKIVAITAAMKDGTGLKDFSERFKDRFFDVGIAEEHAVAFAGGLAREGLRPVVAIYSTFIQRTYDQIFQDVCLQGLPVVFCLDRAGLVSGDGPTHHGVFDMAFLRNIPNIAIGAPKDGDELIAMLEAALGYSGPVVVRYPKNTTTREGEKLNINIGECEVIIEGKGLLVSAIGSMVNPSYEAVAELRREGYEICFINARFVKPLDSKLINIASRARTVVTVEESVLDGGFGSAVCEALQDNLSNVRVKRLGLPSSFIEHGPRDALLKKYGLDKEGIKKEILSICE